MQFPNTVSAAAVESEKVCAGVVEPVATEVVKIGDKFPEVKFVTLPPEEVIVMDTAPVAAFTVQPETQVRDLTPAAPPPPPGYRGYTESKS